MLSWVTRYRIEYHLTSSQSLYRLCLKVLLNKLWNLAYTKGVRSHAQNKKRKHCHCQPCNRVEQSCAPVTRYNMCLSLKQLEWAEVYRCISGNEEEPITQRKIQKFPSRQRNYAVRRKNNNNNMRSHINCQSCARAQEETR